MGGALWKAFVFGVVVAAAIGPIALLIFGTAARRGIVAGGFAGLGAALADFLYALAAFSIGALLLPPLAAHATTIRLACALLLVALGLWMIWQQLQVRDAAAAAPRAAGSALLPTFTLTIVNPLTLVVFAGIVPQLPVAGSFGNAAWLAVALFAGSLMVQLAIAGAGAGLGMALPGRRWQRAINLASAAGILAFGLAGLVTAT
ncbi:MAG TPA: LysE family transporter [Steroidobacteraceae bacterium]|nr:LysE family transporter [Steroidobacteraceae bacterium]